MNQSARGGLGSQFCVCVCVCVCGSEVFYINVMIVMAKVTMT